MKKLFVMFMMFLFTSVAFGADIDTRGLSKAQEAELTIQAEKMKEGSIPPVVKTVQSAVPTVETVSRWAEAGKSLAVGLGAGAKEVGVAVNEFSNTRVGRITTYIIIWKLMGKEILGLIVAFLIVFIAVPVLWKTLFYVVGQTIEYEDRKFLWFTVRRKKKVQLHNFSDGDTVIFMMSVASTIGLFTFAMHCLPF